MNHSNYIICVSMLCTLAGCAAGNVVDTQPGDETSPAEAAEAALVHGSVSSTFTVKHAEQCQPLGVALTSFLTDAFGPPALVADEATAMSETECLHEQVLKAPPDAWAKLARNVLCGGGGDVRLCGTLDKRQCAVEHLMKWAEPRSKSAFARDSTFAFDYLVPRQEEPARVALYRLAQEEVKHLLAEAPQVIRENAAGTRDCPNESSENMAAAYAKGEQMSRELGDILSDDTDNTP